MEMSERFRPIGSMFAGSRSSTGSIIFAEFNESTDLSLT
jgi:hypothetical protein